MTKRFDLSKFTNEALENDPRAFLEAAISIADYYGFGGHDVSTDIGYCRYQHGGGEITKWYSVDVNAATGTDWQCVNVASLHDPIDSLNEFITAIEAHLKGGKP
jgi:hypothetical protein